MKHKLTNAFCWLLALSANASDTIKPGEFYTEPATFHSLGFQWNMSGDDNRNATVAVDYRKQGTAEWRKALDLLRIKGEVVGSNVPEKQHTCGNLFAGSVLFLESGTNYDLRLTLTDPDNGRQPVEVRELTVSTKVVPRPFANGRKIHIRPGDDFMKAYNSAKPGDHILLHAGHYSGAYTLTKKGTREKPIVIRDAGDGEVVFQPKRDGDDGKIVTTPIKDSTENHWHLESPCFEVGDADYHWFEGLTFKNYNSAVHVGDQGTTRGLTVRHCRSEDHGWAAVFTRSVRCRDIWIADNVFIGTQGTWHRKEQKKWPYKGVWVNGQGVDVGYNRCQNHKDGISVYGKSGPTENFERKVCAIDFYHNDVGQSWDDNEADDGQHNIRFFNNRFVDQHVGLSAQPIYGGPCYFVRNVQYNVTRSVAFKLNVEPAGVLMFHNTTFGSGKGNADIGRNFSNCQMYNNLFYGLQGPTLSAGPRDDLFRLDHNGYNWTGPIDWMPRDPESGRNKRRAYKDFPSFTRATGQSAHAVLVDWQHLKNVPKPEKEVRTIADLNFGDARPTKDSPAVDSGMILPNINDDYTDKAPDLGAYELGSELPQYGPRIRD